LQQQALELCKLICAESGLGWNRRLQGVHSGLTGEGGFPEPIASYLGSKYGYDPEAGATYSQQVAEQLGQLATVLQQQRSLGQPFYLGNRLTAVDIYSATFMAMFKPLPQTECPMLDPIRTVFESVDDRIQQALDPILLEHRDFIYREYLELPLKL
ncbi:MAG: hypothetical protein MI864_05165, partial [Pseudomonadales bacterium]|nr:hypothetical protein [Pseudomonadales bacterium]